MARLILDQETLGLSSLMERLTGAKVKDCFKNEEVIYFVVGIGELGKAVGKQGVNIKRVQEELKKRIRIIEYRDSVVEFIKNIIYPTRVEEVVQQDNLVLIKDSSKKTKSLLIGRDGRNLKLINRAVKRFFNVDVKVV
jgi:N utilization substance protein A